MNWGEGFNNGWFILIIPVLLLLISCESNLSVGFENSESYYCCHAIVNPDTTLSVRVKRAYHYAFGSNPARGTSVYYSVNGGPEVMMSSHDGDDTYTSDLKPSCGDKIHFLIKDEDGKIRDSHCEIVVPDHPKFEVLDAPFSEGANFKCRITDPAGEKNYYRITYAHVYSIGDSLYVDSRDSRFTSDAEIFYSNHLEKKEFFNVFSDETFDGKVIDFEIKGNLNVDEMSNNRIVLECESITEELYYYLLSMKSFSMDEGFFGEPPYAYTNVQGGTGLIAGMACKRYRYEVSNPLSMDISGGESALDFAGETVKIKIHTDKWMLSDVQTIKVKSATYVPTMPYRPNLDFISHDIMVGHGGANSYESEYYRVEIESDTELLLHFKKNNTIGPLCHMFYLRQGQWSRMLGFKQKDAKGRDDVMEFAYKGTED